MRQGDHDILLGDQVLDLQVRVVRHDLRTPLVAVAGADIVEFIANNLQQLVRIGKNLRKLFNFF